MDTTENSEVRQEVPLIGTDAREALRHNVAQAICLADGYFGRDPECLNGKDISWDHFHHVADAAMDAFLAGLEQMELPEEVSRVGRETLLTHGNTLDDAFRAICAALRAPKTASEASR